MRAEERKHIDWKPENIEFIRGRYVAGQNSTEISDALWQAFGLQCSAKSLQSIIYRYCRDEVDAKHKGVAEARNDLQTKARELAAEGMASADIAKALNVTIDRIYGWVDKEHKRPWSRRTRSPSFDFGKWLARQERSAIPEDPIVEGGRLITELASDECRWPIGKDGDGLFRFCGCRFEYAARTVRLSPYCDAHVMVSIKPRLPAIETVLAEPKRPHPRMKVDIIHYDQDDGPIQINVVSDREDQKIAA